MTSRAALAALPVLRSPNWPHANASFTVGGFNVTLPGDCDDC